MGFHHVPVEVAFSAVAGLANVALKGPFFRVRQLMLLELTEVPKCHSTFLAACSYFGIDP